MLEGRQSVSDVGALVSELVEAGVDPVLAARVISQAFTAGVASAPYRDGGQTARQARNARYYQNKRLKTSETVLIKTIKTDSDASKTLSDAATPDPSCARVEVLPLLTKGNKEERKIYDQREQARLISIEFEEHFWPAYPRRVAKADAMKAFAAARKKGADLATILAGLERYKRHKPDYADWKHPGPWLRSERWNDEPILLNGHSASPVLKLSDIPDYHAVQEQKRLLGIIDDD